MTNTFTFNILLMIIEYLMGLSCVQMFANSSLFLALKFVLLCARAPVVDRGYLNLGSKSESSYVRTF